MHRDDHFRIVKNRIDMWSPQIVINQKLAVTIVDDAQDNWLSHRETICVSLSSSTIRMARFCHRALLGIAKNGNVILWGLTKSS